MLYKVVTQGEIMAGEIARELVLDPGYLSRILREFEDDCLVKRKSLPAMRARQSSPSLAAAKGALRI